jgi:hypothetical protein
MHQFLPLRGPVRPPKQRYEDNQDQAKQPMDTADAGISIMLVRYNFPHIQSIEQFWPAYQEE